MYNVNYKLTFKFLQQNRKLSTNSSKSNNKYYIKHYCYGKSEGLCNAKGITQLKLEKYFIDYLNKFDLKSIKVDITNENNNNIINEIYSYKNELTKANERKKKLQYLLLDNIISINDYKIRIKEHDDLINEINKNIDTINQKTINKPLSKEQVNKIFEITQSLKKSWSLLPTIKKKEFVRHFIKEIKVINDEGTYILDIEFNI